MTNFMCSIHGIDYRIICTQCQEKNKKINKAIRKTIKKPKYIAYGSMKDYEESQGLI